MLSEWINTRFVLTGLRRALVGRFLSSAVDAAGDGRVDVTDSISTAVESFGLLIPRRAALQVLLLSVWRSLIEPSMKERDRVCAVLDG